jgi:hypothetical protein
MSSSCHHLANFYLVCKLLLVDVRNSSPGPFQKSKNTFCEAHYIWYVHCFVSMSNLEFNPEKLSGQFLGLIVMSH